MVQQQYTTIIVLIAGVFGGLGLVILLILFCKHCINKPSKETGLEIDEIEADVNAASIALLDKTSPESKTSACNKDHSNERRLQRQNDVRLDTIDFVGNSLDFEEADPGEQERLDRGGWRGVITVDDADIYSRIYPDNQLKHDSNLWLGAGMTRSRPTSRLALNTLGSTCGSRRTLQSSLDSSVCTDNRSEITVIEVPPGERYPIDQTIRSASQDDARGTPTVPPRMYLSAFRPVAQKRRQSSHTEIGRTHEKLERRIKSHDDTLGYRLQKQDRAVEESSNYQRQNSAQLEHQRRSPLHSPRVERPSRSFERHSSSQNHLDVNTVRYPRRSSDVGDYNSQTASQGYKDLWRLRSTLEEDDTNNTDQLSIEEKQPTPVATSNNETLMRQTSKNIEQTRVVCSVVYTSFESESCDQFEETIPNEAEEEVNGAYNRLHPPEQTFVSRRQHFRRYIEGYSSTEKSFDSFDTTTTDGARSSDSSRVEVTTTSFESSTTNEQTDSSESSVKRIQMKNNKDDSGYRSIENQQQVQNSIKRGETTLIKVESPEIEPRQSAIVSAHYSKTVSRRRRDFQNKNFIPRNIITSHSSFELETTDSNPYTSESLDEPPRTCGPNKYSVFFRTFQTNSRFGRRRQHMQRDYSVDERTDALFKEFTRYDPQFEQWQPRHYSRSCSNPTLSYLDNATDRQSPENYLPLIPSGWVDRREINPDFRAYNRRAQTDRLPVLQASIS